LVPETIGGQEAGAAHCLSK